VQLLQKANGAARTSPEALYARALLALPYDDVPANDDARLDEDLKAAPDVGWVQLARAVRLDDADRRRPLELAAFGAPPTAHATWRLARWLIVNGDLLAARAALERLFRLAPRHAGGTLTAMLLAAQEAATAGRDGAKAARSSSDEARARARIVDGDGPDEDRLALVLAALTLARGGEVDAALSARLAAAAARSEQGAERALELHLLDGDIAAAQSVARAFPEPARRSLLADGARVRFLGALPDDERAAFIRAAATGTAERPGRGVDADGLRLPLGRLLFPSSASAVFDGTLWTARPDPNLFPERRIVAVTSDARVPSAELAKRLVLVERLALVDRALARGDLTAAARLVDEARAVAGADVDVLLAEAALRVRQNDRAAARPLLETIVAAAPDDPGRLLAAARLALDVEDLVGCRRAVLAFQKLGLRSAAMAAVVAVLEARGNDAPAARAALGEARKLGGGDDVLVHRATILVERSVDPPAARAAADRLVALQSTGGGDIVGAWMAEAQYRAGEQPRAEAALRAITAAQPGIGEAHLFLAQTIAFNPAASKEAFDLALRAMDRMDRGPLLEEARALALKLKGR
jgi:hypothetical protein